MKDLITDAIRARLGATLESVGGANAVFGEPITLDGEQVIPVARISISLDARAAGGGSGGASLPLPGSKRTAGGGEGDAGAGISVTVEPAGLVRRNGDEMVFVPVAD